MSENPRYARFHPISRFMKTQRFTSITCLLAAATMALLPAQAAKTQATPAATTLNDAGRNLASGYSAILKSLENEIQQALPKVDESLKADFTKAVEAVPPKGKIPSVCPVRPEAGA